MSKKDFDKFVSKEQKEEESDGDFDWNQEKDSWLKYLDMLYKDVYTWLSEYIADNRVKVSENIINITETYIGTYQAKELVIRIGNSIATLTPIGTVLIATKGRVDLTSNYGKIRLILTDKDSRGPRVEGKIFNSKEERGEYDAVKKESEPKQIEWVWRIATNPPNVTFLELTQDTFLESLLEVMND